MQLGAIFLQKKLLRQLDDNLAVMRRVAEGSSMEVVSTSSSAAARRQAAAAAAVPVPASYDPSDTRLARARVETALRETDLSTSRSAKLTIDDFLRLLVSFNKHGIHFA
jgi:hypothetical protein